MVLLLDAAVLSLVQRLVVIFAVVCVNNGRQTQMVGAERQAEVFTEQLTTTCW